MKVIVAQHAGFCGGVKSAVERAEKLAKEHGKIYTLGELVHNELVTEKLVSNGVFCHDPNNFDDLKSGDVVLVRAHGIEKEKEQELISKGVVLFDATCPVVKRNQKLAEERASLGDFVIIVGDKKHDEVVGLKSYAGANSIVVSDSEVDELLSVIETADHKTTCGCARANINVDGTLDELKNSLAEQKSFSVLFQTTVLAEKYQEIAEKFKIFEKNSGKTFGIFNTICYTTKERQDETRALAGVSQALIVLGSQSSANTRRLVQVGKEVNPRTYFVHNEEEAKALLPQIQDIQCVSIAAGASTPPWLIREVTKYMSETQNKAQETEVIKEATLQEANEPQTMDELMKSTPNAGFVNYKPGKRVTGKVIFADENGIHVAIGGKKDGFIDKDEAALDGNYNPADYKAGDELQAIILSVGKDNVLLSKKQIDEVVAQEEEAEKALQAGEFTLQMTEVVKGGLRGKLGKYTVFVPASQIRIGYVSNLEDYKGKTLRLTLMPQKEKVAAEGEEAEAQDDKPQKKSRYLFASQRIILEREKKEKEDLFWDNIHVHDIVTGKVKRFTAFGAFVSVRGFDCLAHISELSWNKITDPAKVLNIGESYDFVVLKMDRETGKISLGYKQLQKKPYEVAAEKFPVGTIIKGKVERIFPYGAFVSIDDGVDGLVHVSQISHNWIKDANEALTVGQEVEAKIIGFDDNRITLSIKELLPAPEEAPAQEGEAAVEATDEEKAAKRAQRAKKFEKKEEGDAPKRERRGAKKESSSEPKEWVSGSSNATLGDLLGSLNLDLEDEKKD